MPKVAEAALKVVNVVVEVVLKEVVVDCAEGGGGCGAVAPKVGRLC